MFKRVGMKASEELELTGAGGLVLVGALIKRFTSFQAAFNNGITKGNGSLPLGDVLIAGLATLCTGKSDFAAVSALRNSSWAARALQIGRICSPETLRQDLDLLGSQFFPMSIEIFETAILDVLRNTKMKFTRLSSGHVALDIDTTPQNNSKTKKEGVSRTYAGYDGYQPLLAYAGTEGFLIGADFREGSQHGQKGAPAFLRKQIQRLHSLGVDKVLARLDSGFDAVSTMLTIMDAGDDFIISCNPRQEDQQIWIDQARKLPRSAWLRIPGLTNLRIAYIECMVERKDENGRKIKVRRIVRVKKRIVIEVPKKDCHWPIINRWVEFEVGASWYTTLDLPVQAIAKLYEDHGTSEQFHSELKGELDLERMPSGKFNTNALVFQLGCLAYNVLRVLAIKGRDVFKYREKTKRKRLKTVIQELIMLPAKFLGGSNQVKLDIGKSHPGRTAILRLHQELVPPYARAA